MERASAEIEQELSALREVRGTVPPFTAFRHDNFAAIDAQIKVLEERMNIDTMRDEFVDGDAYIFSGAMDAQAWLEGVDDLASRHSELVSVALGGASPAVSWRQLASPLVAA
jgi:hypothetical protein